MMRKRPSALAVAVAALVVVACGGGSASQAASHARVELAPGRISPFEDVSFVTPAGGWAVTVNWTGQMVQVSRTSDGGHTWSSPLRVAPLTLSADGGAPHFGVRFADESQGWVYGDGIYASSDAGRTWIDTGVRSHVFDVAPGGDSFWAMTGCDVSTSATCAPVLLWWDKGAQTWRPAPHQPPVVSSRTVHLIRVGAARAFIAEITERGVGLAGTRLIATDDGGATWRLLPNPCGVGFGGFPLATADGVHVWVVCASEPGAGEQLKDVYTTSDGGNTWVLRAETDLQGHRGQISVSGYVGLLALASSDTGFLTMARSDIYRSTDGGVTWVRAGLGLGEGFFPALWFVDATHGWVSAWGNTGATEGKVVLYRTVDAGASWTLVSAVPGTA